jgi:peptidoglycan/LPS O-acetylase OafA/YrhL
LNGIKAISSIGVFFGHSFGVRVFFPYRDGSVIKAAVVESNVSRPFHSCMMLMETFFIISGVLVSRSLARSENFSFWRLFVQRYMRLTLPSLVLICCSAFGYTLLKLSPWPYAYIDHTVIDDCKNYWWTTALNIQTLVNPKNMVRIESFALRF